MKQDFKKIILRIDGMTCYSCEKRIENALGKLEGVSGVKADYAQSNVSITYDQTKLDQEKIVQVIRQLDYNVMAARKTLSINQLIGAAIIIFAAYLIIKNTIGFNFIPEINQNMGYGILFFVGVLTSLHCIAMCGGINLSQCIPRPNSDQDKRGHAKFRSGLLYNLGRVLSYTLIGGIVGALGSVVSLPGAGKGLIAVIAGVFMVIMGLNMLNIFPWLRKLNPRMPRIFSKLGVPSERGKRPFFVGLFNGLMPCGPLQAMQIYALGTGSFVAGAASMLFFSLGTVPLMFGLGAVSSLLGSRFTQKMMKASALLVIVLGVIMVGRGLNLSGVALASPGSGSGSIARVEGNVQYVTTELKNGRYQPIVVQKGIPVKWTIKADAEDLDGCNNPVTIPKYNLQKRLVPGDNLVEFTPQEEGNITYTCWMGMIRSNIKVVPDITAAAGKDDIVPEDDIVSEDLIAPGESADEIKISIPQVENNQQEVTITVNDDGFSPAVIVLQKGAKFKINFAAKQLNYCNSKVIFPEYQGMLDLKAGQTETPYLTAQQDFTFSCWMGMLNGFVKVVDDVKNIDREAIKTEIKDYKAARNSSGLGGASCH